jgi:hypothetical protein
VIEVASVVFFIVLALLLAAVDGAPSVVRWFARFRTREVTGPRPASASTSAEPGDPWATVAAINQADSHGERVEAVLTTRLFAGHLSAEQYRQGMAVLAEQDAIRRPLVVPPQPGV